MEPRNRVRVDGADLYAAYGLVLSDDYEIGVPEPKVYTADLLGDGSIDLTGAVGGPYYSNRVITLPLFVPARTSQASFERLKTTLACALSGKRAEIEFAFDPGYTYTGRVTRCSFERRAGAPCAVLTVTASPYKTMGRVVFRANAAGGVRLLLENGRAPSQPTVEVYRDAVLSFEGRDWKLAAGTWQLEDFWLHEGMNAVVVNTTPEYCTAYVSDYAGRTLGELWDIRLSDLMQGGLPAQGQVTIADLADVPISEIRGKTIAELAFPSAGDAPQGSTDVYFAYEWRDL